jgi:hypothetical protein
LKQLKAFLLTLGRLIVKDRMAVAAAEIRRGKERLWLGPDGIEDAVQINGSVMTDGFEREVAARVGHPWPYKSGERLSFAGGIRLSAAEASDF